MTIQIGDTLPNATLTLATASGPKPVESDELFGPGKTIVLFAVPGAFTPTCSNDHLPGFVQRADEIKSKGVDSIVCLSVNDPFVMAAWGEAKGVGEKVVMIADGNADFTKQLGLELDASGFGMGTRAQRFSMIVKDGKVSALNVDPGGSLASSTADKILEQL